jgi:soluble lytic murein transglycosylase
MYKSVLLCSLIFLSGGVGSNTLNEQRNAFLMAEKWLNQDNEAAFLAISPGLINYPLYPYLQYQWLKNHLQQTDQVRGFLSAYKATRYADLLRAKWLEYLAEQGRWLEFIQYYQPGENNIALECQFYWAQYKTGNSQRALNEARRLWSVIGASQPAQCDSLLSELILSPVLTTDLIWQRFEAALKKDNIPLAEYLHRLLDKPQQNIASIWLQVHKNPALVKNSGFWISDDNKVGPIFAHGVDRMSKSDLESAIEVWDSRKHYFSIDNETVQQLERRFALALAFRRHEDAYSRLNRLAVVDEEVREWKIRAALFEQNWQHVAAALTGLTAEQREEPRWQYWQARSLAATGDIIQAQSVYNKLAADRSFYGFLAADRVNKPYSLTDKPVFVAENQLAALAGDADFKMVQEFRFHNRELEAQKQWWFAIKKLPKERIATAAKLAQQWQWDQIAIVTLVKADYWDDLALRFPVMYLNQVQQQALRQDIEPAIIFGLMRQESMLDKNAQSPVGAKGLMQLMPKTGQQIARTLNERWQSENSLFDPEINIRYGSHYYKQLLNRFNGHFALATAAYNAGPNRSIKWLPLTKSMPADIWIETIPFKETRKYVTSVFSYTIIYQQRIQRTSIKMKDLMQDVLPG